MLIMKAESLKVANQRKDALFGHIISSGLPTLLIRPLFYDKDQFFIISFFNYCKSSSSLVDSQNKIKISRK